MSTDHDVLSEATTIVRGSQRKMAVPADGECLHCWLERAVATFGCDHQLTWTKVWARRRARTWSPLRTWLKAQGGSCDCEVVANVCTRPLTDLTLSHRQVPQCAAGPREPQAAAVG